MGDIAGMMLDGILDEQTGEYLGEATGYPRTKEKGHYNTINTKPNLGGQHLVGKEIVISKYGKCTIIACKGKRGKKRYTVIDEKNNKHILKFNQLEL